MSRIAETFARCRAEDRAALVGYLTAFDPDLEGSRARLLAACDAGLDILELGVPFSDPTADGPDVQGAMVRALQAGATVDGTLSLAAEVRARFPGPIVLFAYANPLLAYGPARLVARASEVGIDALLVVDLPAEHAGVLRDPARAAGLDWIGLVAPTTGPDRLGTIMSAATGFVYAVALKGVTGAALDAHSPELTAQLAAIRGHAALPVAVGFGIRNPAQAATIAAQADAVVVGSALIRAGLSGPNPLRDLVQSLRPAMVRRAPPP